MRGTLALARKDLRVLARVRSGVFFTFGWPLIVAVLFGMVLGQGGEGPSAIRVALVDEDRTEASRAFAARLEASGDFVLDRTTRAEAERLVRRGRRSAYIVIPRGFGEASGRLFYGPPRRLEVGYDPSRPAVGSMVQGLLLKHAMADVERLFADPDRSRRMVAEALKALGPAAQDDELAPLGRFLHELERFLGTPAARRPAGGGSWRPVEIAKTAVARDRLVPSKGFDVTFPQGVVWGIIGCVMTFAIGLVSERARGTFLRLQAAPLSRGQILAGKALACFTAIVLLEVALLALGVIGFGIRPSSYGLLALAGVAAAAGFVGFMMMIAGLTRTEEAAAAAGWAVLLPMALFGGAMIPQFAMPGWMQAAGYASPVRWAILGLEGAVWRGFTLREMLAPALVLVVFGAACFAVGVRGLRRR